MIEIVRYMCCGRCLATVVLLFAFTLSTMSLQAFTQDKLVLFSTPGPDRYADGTLVADGECYALVWSPAGQTFAGFNADGTTISADDQIVLAGSLAKDGRCDALFQIAAEDYDALKGGVWTVCLVDTRTANGVPAGVADNRPLRINRYGAVDGTVKISKVSSLALQKPAARKLLASGAKSPAETAEIETGARAGTLSAVPTTAKRPKITFLDTKDIKDGIVRLTVEDTEPYLTYGIASGESPSSLDADGDAGIADGKTGAAIEFEADASGGSRFFKVIRAE